MPAEYLTTISTENVNFLRNDPANDFRNGESFSPRERGRLENGQTRVKRKAWSAVVQPISTRFRELYKEKEFGRFVDIFFKILETFSFELILEAF